MTGHRTYKSPHSVFVLQAGPRAEGMGMGAGRAPGSQFHIFKELRNEAIVCYCMSIVLCVIVYVITIIWVYAIM